MIKYKVLNVDEKIHKLIDLCEKEYRLHHPELDGIYLSKTKIVLEVIKFYLPKKVYNEYVEGKT